MGICESKVRAEFDSRISATRSQTYYLDITHPDANKGDAGSEELRHRDGGDEGGEEQDARGDATATDPVADLGYG